MMMVNTYRGYLLFKIMEGLIMTESQIIIKPSSPGSYKFDCIVIKCGNITAVIVKVVIAAVVSVVVIMAILFKRRGNVVVRKTEASANPAYGTKGQYSNVDVVTSLNSVLLKLFHIY